MGVAYCIRRGYLSGRKSHFKVGMDTRAFWHWNWP